MREALRRWGAGAVLLLSAAAPLHVAAQEGYRISDRQGDPRQILDRAAAAYATAGSFTADFRQVISDENIGTFRSRGRLAQQGTDKFSMRFTQPKGEALVMDGTKLWVYTPSTTPGQVIRMDQPTGNGAPNLVAWLLDHPNTKYRSTWIERDTAYVDVVRLVPIDHSLPFREALVTFDPNDGLPRRIEVVERSGTRRTLTLTNVRTGRQLSAATFQFQVPSGVRIVDQ